MADYRLIGACRLCDGKSLGEVIDFGSVALGNNYLATAEEAVKAAEYPLVVNRCEDCGHFQLGHAVRPELLYATNYSYLTRTASTFVHHLGEYAAWAAAKSSLKPNDLVVDIGSNDGTTLKMFQRLGFRVRGVDPAPDPANLANEDGVPTLNTFFGSEAVAQIKSADGPAHYVTSHNVLAHVDDLAMTFRNIYDLLVPGGYFCFEIGYFREVLRNGFFDTIYHEHLDYHHAMPLTRHLIGLGFDIEEFSVNTSQGGSLRTLCRKTGNGHLSPAAEAFISEERRSELNDPVFLRGWRASIERKMTAFREMIIERKGAGATVSGYGAPTKATLLMKVAGVGPDDVRYVFEENKLKAGRYMPVTGIPIIPAETISSMGPDVFVIFAWNFASEITGKLKRMSTRPVELIVPLPEPRIVQI